MELSKASAKALSVIFCLTLGGLSLLSVLLPDRDFSEQENRTLQQLPVFSAEALFSGEYGREIDRYLSDQFPGRDFFVEVKSRTERATGRREVNGVYFLKNGALAERFLPGDLTRAEANADAVRRFSEAVDVPVTFALIPSAGGVYSEELPYGAPQTDQRALTDALYTRYGGSTADLYSALRARRGEEIYFRTDHHWTPLGAYYGYCASAEAMGLTPGPAGEFVTFSEAFYGTLCRRAGSYDLSPDRISAPLLPGVTLRITEGEETREAPVYDRSFLEKTDKYSLFLGGDHPLAVLSGGVKNGKKLLLVKDSYADCEAAYFLSNFEEVHLIDLRYYRLPLSDYVAREGISQVLVSYGLPSFTTDGNLAFLR